MPKTWRMLTDSLNATTESTIEMSFAEVSRLVDVPKNELKRRDWWNDNSPQGKAWRDAGYTVNNVDTDAESVTFTQT